MQDTQTLIVYREEMRSDAIHKAELLRQQGSGAVLAFWEDNKTEEDYQAYARRMHMTEIIFL